MAENKEELAFSALQPSLFVIASPAFYYIFSDKTTWFYLTHNPLAVIFSLPLVLFAWRQLRITFLMLLCKPAVVLTNEAITITERNYTIYWRDIMDVFMAYEGGAGVWKTRLNNYIILRERVPEKYIKAIKNPFTRYYRWYTRNWGLSTFEVNLFLVRGDDEEIYHLVLKYFQNNRGF